MNKIDVEEILKSHPKNKKLLIEHHKTELKQLLEAGLSYREVAEVATKAIGQKVSLSYLYKLLGN